MARKTTDPSEHAATGRTRSRWHALERNRLLIAIPFALVMLYRVFSSEGGMGGLVTILIVGGITAAIYWYWAYRPGRQPPEGADWSGLVALDIDGFRASPLLQHAAPPSGLRAGMTFGDGFVHGRLSLGHDTITWEPISTSRWGKARPWTLRRADIRSAEVGELPGHLGAAGFKKIYEGLTLNLADGTSLAMYVTGQRDLHDVLVRLGIPGPGSPPRLEA